MFENINKQRCQAILTHLENMEDTFQADEIMERVNRGEEPVLSAGEMRKSLGLDGCTRRAAADVA